MIAQWNFALWTFFLLCPPSFAQTSKSAHPLRDPKLPVLKAKTPIEIAGTVVAHESDGGVGLGSVDSDVYVDYLVIHIEKKLEGRVSGKYVRADFLGEGRTNLPRSLFEGTNWKMKLGSGNGLHICEWTIPPEPPPGSFEPLIVARLIAVGGAKSFPDVNALPCYSLELGGIQELPLQTHP